MATRLHNLPRLRKLERRWSRELFVADTNNHAIRVADLAQGQVRTLELRGLEPPADA